MTETDKAYRALARAHATAERIAAESAATVRQLEAQMHQLQLTLNAARAAASSAQNHADALRDCLDHFDEEQQ